MKRTPDRTIRIAVLDDYQRAATRYLDLDRLRESRRVELTVHTDRADSDDELVARMDDADVVIVMRERSPLSRSVLERLQRTRLIVTSGSRNDSIDVGAAAQCGIVVCGTEGTDSAAAELTWGLLLALLRRIPAEDAGIRDGAWGVHVGETLQGKTLGLVGLGPIGRDVARFGLAFGMRVLAYSRSLSDSAAAAMRIERAASLEVLLRESDVVSLLLRLVEETRGCIGSRELAWMKESSYLVNTARGALIDEAALVRALERGRIRGAALDVFDTEPLPADSPLRSLPNVVLTPHIGYVSHDRYVGYFGQAVEDIEQFLAGEPIRVLA